MDEAKQQSYTPAYLSVSTFNSFIESLKVALPTAIDKSLMRSMSGTAQSQLVGALKFLGLTDDKGNVQPLMKRLVESDKDRRPEVLKEILEGAYPFLTDPGFDLAKATSGALADKIREFGVTGETVRKAMSFFATMAGEAGLEVSPHIKPTHASNGSATGKKRTSPRKTKTPKADENEGMLFEAIGASSLTATLLEKFPAFDPKWKDEELKKKWFEGFAELMERTKGQ